MKTAILFLLILFTQGELPAEAQEIEEPRTRQYFQIQYSISSMQSDLMQRVGFEAGKFKENGFSLSGSAGILFGNVNRKNSTSFSEAVSFMGYAAFKPKFVTYLNPNANLFIGLDAGGGYSNYDFTFSQFDSPSKKTISRTLIFIPEAGVRTRLSNRVYLETAISLTVLQPIRLSAGPRNWPDTFFGFPSLKFALLITGS